MAKTKNRPSVQLLIDREKVRQFKILCLIHQTNMSKVVEEWIDIALKAKEVKLKK